MLRLTVRNIFDKFFRFALTSFAVVLGVAFLVGTGIITDSLRDTFDELSFDIVGPNVDLVARTNLNFGDEELTLNRLPMPEGTLEVIRGVDGVADAEPRITTFNVGPIDAEGEVVEGNGPQLGVNYSGIETFNRQFIVEGRAPTYTGEPGSDGFVGEFMIDSFIDDRWAFEVGTTYRLFSPGGQADFTLVGVFNYADPEKSKSVGATLVSFDDRTAQEFLNRPGSYDEVVIAVEETADPVEVAAAVDAALEDNADAILADFIATLIANPDLLPPGLVDQFTSGDAVVGDADQVASVDLEVITGDQLVEETQGGFATILNILGGVLQGFAFVAILVSGFIINNTFAIVLGQRTRELGLLRALGATGKQVSRSVRLEALLVGLFSTLAGIGLGVLLAILLRWLLVTLDFGQLDNRYPLSLTTIIAAFVVGVGITMLSSILPARKARQVSPMDALRTDARLPEGGRGRRTIAGVGAMIVGIAMLVIAVVTEPETLPLITLLALGALVTLIGAYLLSPLIARAVTQVLGGRAIGAVLAVIGVILGLSALGALVGAIALIARGDWILGLVVLVIPLPLLAYSAWSLVSTGVASFNVTGQIARDNAGRSPRRTASTAAALTIGLALVSTVAVVAASLLATFNETLDRSIEADYFLFVSTFNPNAGFSPDVAIELDELTAVANPPLESVVAYRFSLDGLEIDGSSKDVFGADFSLLERHINPSVLLGDIGSAGPRGLILHEDPAADLGLAIGDEVAITFPGSPGDTFTVAAIYEDSTVLGNWVIDIAAFDVFLPNAPDGFVTARVTPGVDAETAEAAIRTVTDEFPQIRVEDRETFRETQEAQLSSILAIIIVFLGLTFAIAVLGIANTLALSVFERTREIGLLRAVGMTRRQAAGIIRGESVIVSLFGGVLGVLLGLLFGIVISIALPETFVDKLAIPWSQLAAFLIATTVFAVLAAFFPGRRAARMNILEAISHE